MTTNDLQSAAAAVNMKLDEVNVLYLRFKMLEPSPSGLVPIPAFDQKNGTGFRHNRILARFIKTIYLDEDLIDFKDFLKMMKWWKMSDLSQKLRRVFEIFDDDEDSLIPTEELDTLLDAVFPGDESCPDESHTPTAEGGPARTDRTDGPGVPPGGQAQRTMHASSGRDSSTKARVLATLRAGATAGTCSKDSFVEAITNCPGHTDDLLVVTDTAVYDVRGNQINTASIKRTKTGLRRGSTDDPAVSGDESSR